MKLSTQTLELSKRFGDENAIRRLATAGFDAIDLTLCRMSDDNSPFVQENYREYAVHLVQVAKECGVTFNQTHCPFEFKWDANPWDRSTWKNYETIIFPRHIRALEVSSLLGATTVVVHPLHHMPYIGNEQYVHDINMDFYRSLLPYCKQWNIRVALENMWQRDPKRRFISYDAVSRSAELAAWVDELADPHFVACLDVGHSALIGEEPEDAIRTLGKERLKALHIHDVDYISDLHTLPFLGKLNWNAIMKSLGEIRYEGELTFEADNFLRYYTDETLDMACRFMAETGRRLIQMVNN